MRWRPAVVRDKRYRFGNGLIGGEPSGDPQRQAFLEREMKKACNATHRMLPGLKRKYRGDRLVLARLANIEAWYGGPIP